MSQSFDFTVVLEPQPEGGFTVRVPTLPEVVTEGQLYIQIGGNSIEGALTEHRIG